VTSVVIFFLAATDLILADIGGFGLTPFWPAYALALLQNRMGVAAHGQTRMAWHNLWILALALALTSVISAGGTRASSLLLTLGYLSFGFWLLAAMHRSSPHDIEKVLKYILVAYTVSSVLTWMLIELDSPEDPFSVIAKSSFDINSQTYRIHALSSEPSYSATVVACCILGMLRLRAASIGPSQRELLPWMLVSLVLIACFGSVLGYILAVVVLSSVLNRKMLVACIGLVLLLAGTENVVRGEHRVFNILEGFTSGDLTYWMVLDGSSYMRIGPLAFYIDTANWADYFFWLGHGAASSTAFFGDAFGSLAGKDVETIQVGLIPAFFYDYGLLGAGLFISFAYRCCNGAHKWQAIALFAAAAFNANFNTQMLWFVLAIMALSGTTTVRQAKAPN
jgi:hypothetical protein